MSRTIQFSVDDDHYELIREYARVKGYRNPSNLARKAVYKEIKSYPVKPGEAFNEEELSIMYKDGVIVQSEALQGVK